MLRRHLFRYPLVILIKINDMFHMHKLIASLLCIYRDSFMLNHSLESFLIETSFLVILKEIKMLRILPLMQAVLV